MHVFSVSLLNEKALKDREDMLNRYGTTTETAQASYQVRVLLRNLKENTAELQKIHEKEAKKASFSFFEWG